MRAGSLSEVGWFHEALKKEEEAAIEVLQILLLKPQSNTSKVYTSNC
jgi:hypothetical protein